MNEAQKRAVELVADGFREYISRETDHSAESVNYGREVLHIQQNSPLAALWRAFYAGYGAGVMGSTK